MTLFIDTTDFSAIRYMLTDTDYRFEKNYQADPHQSHEILKFFEQFLKQSKIDRKDIKQIIVNKGPGSYTGTRIGVTHAMALGFAWNIPVKILEKEKFERIVNVSLNPKSTYYIKKPKTSEFSQTVEVINSEKGMYKKIYSKTELKTIGIGDYTVHDLESSKNFKLVAVENHEVLGFISWYIKPNGVAWISLLEVSPKSQGKGVGSALVKKVEKLCLKKTTAIAFEVHKKADWAIKFYSKLGYKELSAHDLNRVPFAKTLPKPPVKNTLIFGKRL